MDIAEIIRVLVELDALRLAIVFLGLSALGLIGLAMLLIKRI